MDSTQVVQKGIRIEIFTIVYMACEAILSIVAAVMAHSILLAAFGIDSVLELISGGILLWRLQVEARGTETDVGRVERAEQRAARGTALVLFLLCLYVLVSALYGLSNHSQAESSPLGIGVSLAAVIVMPILAVQKRRIAKNLNSEAMEEDAVASITCAYMAGTVLVGLLLNALFGWWWVEDVAALVFLFWLGREAWEAFEGARGKFFINE
ncbi:MAG TPA: cation transporter [Anaerolineaceae bacterium]|nr:cation transporter [Anaerolineaceae bacterium]